MSVIRRPTVRMGQQLVGWCVSERIDLWCFGAAARLHSIKEWSIFFGILGLPRGKSGLSSFGAGHVTVSVTGYGAKHHRI